MATKKETTVTDKTAREKELEAALEAMKKEKEALLKENESLKKVPEEEAVPDEDAEYWNERVPYTAFYDGDKYSDDISVKVNGERFLIKRGEEVMIPRKVLHVLQNADKQARFSADYNRKLQEQFEKETKAYIGGE